MGAASDSVVLDDVEFEALNGNPTELARTYFEMEKENILAKLYWDRDLDKQLCIDKFVSMYGLESNAYLFRATHGSDTLGYFLLSDLISGDRVLIGAAFLRRYWGTLPAKISRKFIDLTHERLNVSKIFAFTPWKTAMTLCLRVGMKPVGKIPKYCRDNDIYVFVSEG